MKDQVIHWLARGFQPVKVAEIVGCTAAYVSQIQAAADYTDLLAEEKKGIERSKQADEIEEEYIKLESSVVAQAKDNLAFADFRDLTQMMSALIQRRQKSTVSAGSIVSNVQNNKTFILQVPASVVPELMLNENKEIIAIGGKTLAPMPATGVRELFNAIEDKRKAAKIKVEDLTEMPADF
jgi:hypothetical protein